jgi:hypothetical protein
MKLPVVKAPKPPLLTLDDVVDAYIRDKRPAALAERKTFADEPTFAAAVRRAGLALNTDGTVHSHQARWVWPEVREAWAAKLLDNIESLSSPDSFEDLRERISTLRIDGIGRLTIYDTAYRIGAKLGLAPSLVFLHRGTKKGALVLGLGKRRRWLRPDELPFQFQRLRPYEMEDCLCIYKKDIGRLRNSSPPAALFPDGHSGLR